MLQEQAQQLQQMLSGLGDALKQLNSRIDDQTALERKAFADGKVQMDNLSGDIRVVREKVDETNVRSVVAVAGNGSAAHVAAAAGPRDRTADDQRCVRSRQGPAAAPGAVAAPPAPVAGQTPTTVV